MSIDNQEDKSKNVVWENLSNGTRFMTGYDDDKTYEDNEHHKVIGKELSYDDALVLCKVTESKNISSFLDDMPAELRDPETDAMITAIIKGGGK